MSLSNKRSSLRISENRKASPSPGQQKRKHPSDLHTSSHSALMSFSTIKSTPNKKSTTDSSSRKPKRHRSKLRNFSPSVAPIEDPQILKKTYDTQTYKSLLDKNLRDFEVSQQHSPAEPYRPSERNSDIQKQIQAMIGKEAFMLESRLNQRLGKLTPADNKKKFMIIEETFNRVIESLKPFSGLLRMIKQGYDMQIQAQASNSHAINNYNHQMQDRYLQEKERNKEMAKRLADMEKEMDRLSTAMESKSKLSAREIEDIITENSRVKMRLATLEKELANATQKERVLGKLLQALRARNVPVDQIFEHDVLRKNNKEKEVAEVKKSAPPEAKKLVPSSSQAKLSTSQANANAQRPICVPRLDLTRIKPDEEESYLDEESFYEAQQAYANKYSNSFQAKGYKAQYINMEMEDSSDYEQYVQ